MDTAPPNHALNSLTNALLKRDDVQRMLNDPVMRYMRLFNLSTFANSIVHTHISSSFIEMHGLTIEAFAQNRPQIAHALLQKMLGLRP